MTGAASSDGRLTPPASKGRLSLPALAIAAAALAIGVTTLVFVFLNADTAGVTGLAGTQSRVLDALFGLTILAYPLVGALIVANQPRNAIGWLFAAGLALCFANLAHEFAFYALLTEPDLKEIGRIAAWLSISLGPAGFFPIVAYLLLLFPDGRPLTPRWRWVLWLPVAAAFAVSVGFAVTPGAFQEPFDFVENPLPVEAVEVLSNAVPFGYLGFLIAMLSGAIALFRRFRRSRGIEREQLKWVVTAAAFLVFAWVGGGIFEQVIFEEEEGTVAGEILLGLAAIFIPISVGVAILRYRLYDIDFIINRALVYGLLTAFLAGLYAAAIQLFKVLFQDVSGETSDGSIIITTLLLAAAFTPAKNRLQKVVDHYFGPAHAPTKRLDAYVERLSAFVQALDARESAREFLASAVESLTLQGGAVYLTDEELTDEEVPVATAGDGPGEQPLRIVLAHDGHEAGFLLLGSRLDGLDYDTDDVASLEAAAKLVARAILLANARQAQPKSLAAVER